MPVLNTIYDATAFSNHVFRLLLRWNATVQGLVRARLLQRFYSFFVSWSPFMAP